MKKLIIFTALYISLFISVFAGVGRSAKPFSAISRRTIEDTSLSDLQKDILQDIVTEGRLQLRLIYEIDLDKDNRNEVVLVYDAGVHSSGAKVIRFKGYAIRVIFERDSDTPNTKFKVIDGIPTLTFEESDSDPGDKNKKYRKIIYRWNGRKFDFVRKSN